MREREELVRVRVQVRVEERVRVEEQGEERVQVQALVLEGVELVELVDQVRELLVRERRDLQQRHVPVPHSSDRGGSEENQQIPLPRPSLHLQSTFQHHALCYQVYSSTEVEFST